MKRGTFQFEVTANGTLLDSARNVELIRKLWLDRSMIQGYYLGPGDAGDFDYGAWHVACHLAAAGGVMESAQQRPLWLEISHNPIADDYYASVSVRSTDTETPQTYRLNSAEGRHLVDGATLLGFVEGNSSGRISARGANDSPGLFNLWRRQDFDQPVGSTVDGGKAWEHWCTLRDSRPTSKIATSVLTAYVSLVSVLGDKFAPTVARGRRDYGHPDQLRGLVVAGFTAKTSALWDVKPTAIPAAAERLLLEAEPGRSREAAEKLDWSKPPRYYMFSRRIGSWSSTDAVKQDLDGI
jgi:hypothetical protein